MIGTGERILVTGAKGFLGSHIVSLARKRGLAAIPAHRAPNEAGSVYLDVCLPESIASALERSNASVVIHCAAYGLDYTQQDSRQAVAVNLQGSLSLLEAAKRHGIRRFVHVGTCVEYGSYDVPISEDFALNPTSLYGATKAAGAVLMKERALTLGIDLIIARPFSIWGANDAVHHLIPQVVSACLSRTTLNLSPCEVLRDYLYVEDVAERVLQLSLLPTLEKSPAIVNIGSGRGYVLREFVAAIARELGGEELMRFGALPYRSNEMKALVADTSRLRALMPERATISIVQGVKKIIDARSAA